MKIIFFILSIFLSKHAFSQNFLSVYLSPFIPFNSNNTLIDNSFFLNLDWKPTKFLGSTLYIGAADGFMLGTSINFNYTYPREIKKFWYFSSSLTLPFIMKSKENTHAYFTGASAKTDFSISLSKNKDLFFYLVPFQIFAFPFNWINDKNSPVKFDNKTYLYYSFSVGIRKPI